MSNRQDLFSSDAFEYVKKDQIPNTYESNKPTPIFRRYNSGFSHDRGLITHFCISNSIGLVVIDSIKILVLKNFATLHFIHESFDLSQKNAKVKQLYLHPCGRDALIITNNSDLLYFNMETRNTIQLLRHKLNISMICWNYNNNALFNTILIGTVEGIIYEMEINFDSTPQCKSIHKVLNLSDETYACVGECKITGISSHYLKQYNLVIIIVSTCQNIFRFCASPSHHLPLSLPIFANFKPRNVVEIPSQGIHGDLCVFPPYSATPTHLSWFTSTGVITTNIEVNPKEEEVELKERRILTYTKNNTENLISVQLTQYHCILLYLNRFVAINVLNEEVACNDLLGTFNGTPKGLVWDLMNQSMWYYTNTHIYGCRIHEEDRKVWQILLDKKQFEEALSITKQNPKHHDIVKQRLADHYFQNQEYSKAVELYADTQAPFEPIAMKFMALGNKHMVNLLTLILPRFENKLVQKHIIILWIVDIYMIDLCNTSDDIESVKFEFKTFLRWPLVKSAIEVYPHVYYKIIEQYGNREFLIFLATMLRDYEKLILYHINSREYFDAFQVLKKQNNPDLWYQLSYQFFVILPNEIVSCWQAMREILDPKRLVQGTIHLNLTSKPHLMKCVIGYLEYSIETLKVTDPFIHNYLISLFCISNQHERVQFYLETHSSVVMYDKHYILQLCFQHKIFKACTFILCLMEFYEEAVDLALNIDVSHAKECANKPNNILLKRRLWMIIAQRTLSNQMDVETAEQFLKEAGVIKFEDLLPFFGDFNKIDNFKDAICDSLKSYGLIVEKQKQKIEKLSNISEKLRRKNNEMSKRCIHIEKHAKCTICISYLLVKPFYTFPCNHSFHQVCYIQTFFDFCSHQLKKILYVMIYNFTISAIDPKITIDSEYSIENHFMSNKSFEEMMKALEILIYSQESLQSNKQQIKQRIDELMTHECIYCGNFSIRNIDQPFCLTPGFLDLLV